MDARGLARTNGGLGAETEKSVYYPYNVSYPGTFCLRFFLCDRKARRLRLWMAAICSGLQTAALKPANKGHFRLTFGFLGCFGEAFSRAAEEVY